MHLDEVLTPAVMTHTFFVSSTMVFRNNTGKERVNTCFLHAFFFYFEYVSDNDIHLIRVQIYGCKINRMQI
jgi:hypothetical protein